MTTFARCSPATDPLPRLGIPARSHLARASHARTSTASSSTIRPRPRLFELVPGAGDGIDFRHPQPRLRRRPDDRRAHLHQQGLPRRGRRLHRSAPTASSARGAASTPQPRRGRLCAARGGSAHRPSRSATTSWLGGSVTILPGVTIGDSIIGAGSVVTRDIPAGVVAVGNPCRVVRAIRAERAGRGIPAGAIAAPAAAPQGVAIRALAASEPANATPIPRPQKSGHEPRHPCRCERRT